MPLNEKTQNLIDVCVYCLDKRAAHVNMQKCVFDPMDYSQMPLKRLDAIVRRDWGTPKQWFHNPSKHNWYAKTPIQRVEGEMIFRIGDVVSTRLFSDFNDEHFPLNIKEFRGVG